MMDFRHIRGLAICIFSHNSSILVSEGFDPVKNEKFYRPLGGRIEFGEHSQQALVREIHEEIKAEITDLRYLGTLENLFTFNGQAGHEIVFVYDGAFTDPRYYQQPKIVGYEQEGPDDGQFTSIWIHLDELSRNDSPPLYPDGLLDLIRDYLSEDFNP